MNSKHNKYLEYQKNYYHTNKVMIKNKQQERLKNDTFYKRNLEYHRNYYHKKKYNNVNLQPTITKTTEGSIIVYFR